MMRIHSGQAERMRAELSDSFLYIKNPDLTLHDVRLSRISFVVKVLRHVALDDRDSSG